MLAWAGLPLAILFTAPGSYAQAASGEAGAASPAQGYSVPAMLMELSIFLPEGPGGLVAGSRQETPRGPGRLNEMRTLVENHRDPKLFLDLEQIGTLLPLLQALYQNPFPTPEAARKLQATVDGLLTSGQRSALEGFRKERDALIARFHRQAGAGQGGPGQGPAQPGSGPRRLTPLEWRQRLIEAFIGLLNQRKKELAP
jgi:hypothetical protein